MFIEGELRSNDNYVFLELMVDGNDYYFSWYSNYDYRVYETRNADRVRQIIDGINEYIKRYGTSDLKHYVKIENIELD